MPVLYDGGVPTAPEPAKKQKKKNDTTPLPTFTQQRESFAPAPQWSTPPTPPAQQPFAQFRRAWNQDWFEQMNLVLDTNEGALNQGTAQQLADMDEFRQQVVQSVKRVIGPQAVNWLLRGVQEDVIRQAPGLVLSELLSLPYGTPQDVIDKRTDMLNAVVPWAMTQHAFAGETGALLRARDYANAIGSEAANKFLDTLSTLPPAYQSALIYALRNGPIPDNPSGMPPGMTAEQFEFLRSEGLDTLENLFGMRAIIKGNPATGENHVIYALPNDDASIDVKTALNVLFPQTAGLFTIEGSNAFDQMMTDPSRYFSQTTAGALRGGIQAFTVPVEITLNGVRALYEEIGRRWYEVGYGDTWENVPEAQRVQAMGLAGSPVDAFNTAFEWVIHKPASFVVNKAFDAYSAVTPWQFDPDTEESLRQGMTALAEIWVLGKTMKFAKAFKTGRIAVPEAARAQLGITEGVLQTPYGSGRVLPQTAWAHPLKVAGDLVTRAGYELGSYGSASEAIYRSRMAQETFNAIDRINRTIGNKDARAAAIYEVTGGKIPYELAQELAVVERGLMEGTWLDYYERPGAVRSRLRDFRDARKTRQDRLTEIGGPEVEARNVSIIQERARRIDQARANMDYVDQVTGGHGSTLPGRGNSKRMPIEEFERYVDPELWTLDNMPPAERAMHEARINEIAEVLKKDGWEGLRPEIGEVRGPDNPWLSIGYNPLTREALATEGFHRYMAAKKAGMKDIPVEFEPSVDITGYIDSAPTKVVSWPQVMEDSAYAIGQSLNRTQLPTEFKAGINDLIRKRIEAAKQELKANADGTYSTNDGVLSVESFQEIVYKPFTPEEIAAAGLPEFLTGTRFAEPGTPGWTRLQEVIRKSAGRNSIVRRIERDSRAFNNPVPGKWGEQVTEYSGKLPEGVEGPGPTVQLVHIDQLRSMRGNPIRGGKVHQLSDGTLGTLEDLVADIKANGMNEPVQIYYNEANRTAYVGEGNTRVEAAYIAGYDAVPVTVGRSYHEVGQMGAQPVTPIIAKDASGWIPGQMVPEWIGMDVARGPRTVQNMLPENYTTLFDVYRASAEQMRFLEHQQAVDMGRLLSERAEAVQLHMENAADAIRAHRLVGRLDEYPVFEYPRVNRIKQWAMNLPSQSLKIASNWFGVKLRNVAWKWVDDLPQFPTIYTPEYRSPGRPMEWRNHNVSTFYRWARRAGVDEQAALRLAGELGAVENRAQFSAWAFEARETLRASLPKNLPESIKTELLDWVSRPIEGRGRIFYSERYTSGSGGTMNVQEPIAGSWTSGEPGASLAALPNTPKEYMGSFNLPSVDLAIDASSAIRRSVRFAKRHRWVGGGLWEGAYWSWRYLGRIGSLFKAPVLSLRIPAMATRVQLEQALRAYFGARTAPLTIFPHGLILDIPQMKIFGKEMTPHMRGTIANPDPRYGHFRSAMETDLGSIHDSLVAGETGRYFATDMSLINGRRQAPVKGHYTSYIETLEYIRGERVLRKMVELDFNPDAFIEWVKTDAPTLQWLYEEHLPTLRESHIGRETIGVRTAGYAADDVIIRRWVERNMASLREIIGGDTSAQAAIIHGRYPEAGASTGIEAIGPDGYPLVDTYTQLAGEYASIRAQLTEMRGARDRGEGNFTNEDIAAVQQRLREVQGRQQAVARSMGAEFTPGYRALIENHAMLRQRLSELNPWDAVQVDWVPAEATAALESIKANEMQLVGKGVYKNVTEPIPGVQVNNYYLVDNGQVVSIAHLQSDGVVQVVTDPAMRMKGYGTKIGEGIIRDQGLSSPEQIVDFAESNVFSVGGRQLLQRVSERMMEAERNSYLQEHPVSTAVEARVSRGPRLRDADEVVKVMRKRYNSGDMNFPNQLSVHQKYNWTSSNGILTAARQFRDGWNKAWYYPYRALSWADIRGTRGSMYYRLAEREYIGLRERGFGKSEATRIAQDRAAASVRDLMYDLSARTSMQRTLKDIFWFAPAAQEVLYTWLVKVPTQQAFGAGYFTIPAMGKAFLNLARELDLITTDQDGNEVIIDKGLGRLINALTGQNFTLTYDIRGFNFVASSPIPGLATLHAGILGKLARRYGGVFKALSDIFNQYGSDITATPRQLAYAWEALTGNPWPLEFMSPDLQKAQYDRAYDQSIQMAFASLQQEGTLPPRPENYENETDYLEARDDYTVKLLSEAEGLFRGVALFKLAGSSITPASLHIEEQEREAFEKFMNTVVFPAGREGTETYTERQRQLINDYVAEHPMALAYSIGYTVYGKQQRELPYQSVGDDAFFDEFYTGERRVLTPEEYVQRLMAVESYRFYVDQQNASLNQIGEDASTLLRNGYERRDIMTDTRENWNRWLALNPEAEAIMETSRKAWEERYGIPPRTYEVERLADTIQYLGELGQFFLEGNMRTDEYKYVVGQLRMLYSEEGQFGAPTTQVGKDMAWYFDNVLDPYFTRTEGLYQQANEMAIRGEDASAIWDQIRTINNSISATSLNHNGQNFPRPEEVMYGNRSPYEQTIARLSWATKNPAWLTNYQMEVIGSYPTFKGRDEMIARLNEFDDQAYEEMKDVSPGSDYYDTLTRWKAEQRYAIASQYGQAGLDFLAKADATPAQRLSAAGFQQQSDLWQNTVATADSYAQAITQGGWSPRGWSEYATQIKTSLYVWIEQTRAADPSYDAMWTQLSYTVPADGYTQREGAPLYEAILFGNFRDIDIPPEVISALQSATPYTIGG